MLYSNFIDSGLNPMAAGLTKAGIPFSMIHGGSDDTSRKLAVGNYNSGKHRVILLGPAASEGISLSGTRHVLLLDPAWNVAKMDQAQGRAIRMDSHLDLPLADRNVTVERLISEPRRGILRRIFGMNPGTGADRYLYDRAAEKEKGVQTFLDVLKEAGK
jgi:superfamily II DNA/RNA helicase